jgi:hypothetical protein
MFDLFQTDDGSMNPGEARRHGNPVYGRTVQLGLTRMISGWLGSPAEPLAVARVKRQV